MGHEQSDLFDEENLIYKYSSDQAVEDGFLLDVRILNSKWKDGFGMISHVTTSLLSHGYWETECQFGVTLEESGKSEKCRLHFVKECSKRPGLAQCDFKKERRLRMCNILDLLTQAQRIIIRNGILDTFYSGFIEFPDGVKRKIFIATNEFEKFTIMLPEDY
jgi:hypothetical protein